MRCGPIRRLTRRPTGLGFGLCGGLDAGLNRVSYRPFAASVWATLARAATPDVARIGDDRMRRVIGQHCMFVFLCWVGLGLLVSSTEAAETASLERGNPAAHLFPGDQASEHWDLTARFDSGHVLVAEFIITNIGIGDRNAAAFGYVIAPDGKKLRFRNGRREGNWQISPDRLLIEVGKSRLDLHGPPYQLQVDKKQLKLNIQIRPNGPAAWSDAFSDSGLAIDLLAASASVWGSLWMEGMPAYIDIRGTLALTHSWTEEASTDLIVRRVEFFSLQPECPLYAVDLTAPNGKRTQWMVAKAANNATGWAQQVSFVMDGEAHGSQIHDYPVPGSLRLKAPELEGLIQIQRVLLHDDPFDDLPRIFRWMVSLVLNLRPHRSWADRQKDVKLDIQIQPNGPAAWSDAFSDSRFAIDLLAASATAQGSLWLKGMPAPIDIRGTLALTHSWTEEASTDLILRRVEFFSLQPECPLYAVDLTAPNGKRTQWMVAKAANNATGWAQQVSFVMDGEAHGSQIHDYPVPGSLRLKAPELEGLIQIQRVLLHDDPFDDLPRIFRWMVSLVLNLRPHRSWALSPFELSCPSLQTAHPDIVPLTHGTGMTAVTFLNPLPSS